MVVFVCFPGKRTSEGIIRWLERRAGPGAPLLDSADSAARFIEAHNITVIGFFHVGPPLSMNNVFIFTLTFMF